MSSSGHSFPCGSFKIRAPMLQSQADSSGYRSKVPETTCPITRKWFPFGLITLVRPVERSRIPSLIVFVLWCLFSFIKWNKALRDFCRASAWTLEPSGAKSFTPRICLFDLYEIRHCYLLYIVNSKRFTDKSLKGLRRRKYPRLCRSWRSSRVHWEWIRRSLQRKKSFFLQERVFQTRYEDIMVFSRRSCFKCGNGMKVWRDAQWQLSLSCRICSWPFRRCVPRTRTLVL